MGALTTLTTHLLEFRRRGYPVPMQPLPPTTAMTNNPITPLEQPTHTDLQQMLAALVAASTASVDEDGYTNIQPPSRKLFIEAQDMLARIPAA